MPVVVHITGPLEGLNYGGTSSNVVGMICPPPLVEIGLTDLLKSGGIMTPLAPQAPTGLHNK